MRHYLALFFFLLFSCGKTANFEWSTSNEAFALKDGKSHIKFYQESGATYHPSTKKTKSSHIKTIELCTSEATKTDSFTVDKKSDCGCPGDIESIELKYHKLRSQEEAPNLCFRGNITKPINPNKPYTFALTIKGKGFLLSF